MSAFTTFTPSLGQGVSITAIAATPVNGEVDKTKASRQIAVTNTGTDLAYVRSYNSSDGTESASAADYPIMPQAQVTIGKPNSHDRVSVLSAATPVIHIIKGSGY